MTAGYKVVADLATSWRFLALGVLLSLLLCLAWVWSMRWTAGCLVRASCISTLYLQYIYSVYQHHPAAASLEPGPVKFESTHHHHGGHSIGGLIGSGY